MTDVNDTSDNAESGDTLEPIIMPTCDWTLQALVYQANRFGAGISITLFVKGTVISGAILSAKEYFTRMGQIMEQGWKGVDPDMDVSNISLPYRQLAEQYPYFQEDQKKNDDPRVIDRVSFINLEHARIYGPDGSCFPPLDESGMLWRGRITEISGFMVGSYHSTKNSG